MEKDFYPECQGALKELDGQEEGKMRCVKAGKTRGAGRSLPLQNNDSWLQSKRHMDLCLGTSGLRSWSNECLSVTIAVTLSL